MPADSINPNASKTSISSGSSRKLADSSKIPNNINKKESVDSLQIVDIYLDKIIEREYEESQTVNFSIRIPVRYHRIYKSRVAFSRKKRNVLKKIVCEAIKQLASLNLDVEERTTIVNMNVNINEAVAVAGTAGEDLSIYKERVRQLREQLRDAQEVIKYYKSKNAELSGKVRQLERELEVIRRENDVLKQRLQQTKREALSEVLAKIKQRIYSVRLSEQVKLLLLKLIDSVSEEITDLSPEGGG